MFEAITKPLKSIYASKKQLRNIRNFIKSLGKCGENLQLFGTVDVAFSHNLIIGDNCKLNDKCYLNARSGIELGNDVTVSYDAKLISTGYLLELWITEGEKVHFDNRPIRIGNHCWIGAGAIVLPGVNITGEYVVIGAGAVVTKDITESKVIVAGNPARIIKRLGE